MLIVISNSEFLQIFDGIQKDTQKKDSKGKETAIATKAKSIVDEYLGYLNEAIKIVNIDSIEGVSAFLANAYIESGQLKYMTETTQTLSSNKGHEYESNLNLDRSWLNDAARDWAKIPKPVPKLAGKPTPAENAQLLKWTTMQKVDHKTYNQLKNEAGGDWSKSYIGRGLVQVTTKNNYTDALSYLKAKFNENEKVKEAIEKISANPSEAANPKYAFLFSAAHLDNKGLFKRMKEESRTSDSIFWGMGKQIKAGEKKHHYTMIYNILAKTRISPTTNATGTLSLSNKKPKHQKSASVPK